MTARLTTAKKTRIYVSLNNKHQIEFFPRIRCTRVELETPLDYFYFGVALKRCDFGKGARVRTLYGVRWTQDLLDDDSSEEFMLPHQHKTSTFRG